MLGEFTTIDPFSYEPREYEVRDLIPHIRLIPKVIPLNLFLDMVPSSPADVNARCVDVLACFFSDDQKRNGRKCGVDVACIHFVDELLPRVSRSSVVRAPNWYLGGHARGK